MNTKPTILILLFAIAIPYILTPSLSHLWSRIRLLRDLETQNHPSKLLPNGTAAKGWMTQKGSYKVRYTGVLRNCEDLVLEKREGFAVVSCDEGRDGWNTVMGHFTNPPPHSTGSLYLYDYSRAQPTLEQIRLLKMPEAHSFHPLGLSLHAPTSTLIIANHAITGSALDIFHFSRHGNSATYVRSISSPLLRSPNSILHLNNEEILVTNDHFFTARQHPWLSKLETYLALPLGSIVHINLRTGQQSTIARLAFPNGIALLNATTIAIASSSTAKIHLHHLNTATKIPELRWKTQVAVPFIPDNLHASDHRLLIAGHAHLSSFNAFCARRTACGADFESEGCGGNSATWVQEWSEGQGARDVYVGAEIDTGSSAVWDEKRGVGLISGLYGKGLLVWEDEK